MQIDIIISHRNNPWLPDQLSIVIFFSIASTLWLRYIVFIPQIYQITFMPTFFNDRLVHPYILLGSELKGWMDKIV